MTQTKTRTKREETKSKILETLLNRPKSISQISRDVKTDRSRVNRLLAEMKDLVDTEEKITNSGKCRIVRLKKKAYSNLKNTPSSALYKLSNKTLPSDDKKKRKYINSDEYELLSKIKMRNTDEEW